MLEELGTVLTTSARDHLLQAARSNDPEARIRSAADGFQEAYFAQVRATERGSSRTLRMITRPTKLRRAFRTAGECAAMVAVLEHYLGESPKNIRSWVDRVAKQIAAQWRSEQAVNKAADNPILAEIIGFRATGPGREIYWTTIIDDYFRLESRVLPQAFIRPRPLMRRPVHEVLELRDMGLLPEGWKQREENLLPPYDDV